MLRKSRTATLAILTAALAVLGNGLAGADITSNSAAPGVGAFGTVISAGGSGTPGSCGAVGDTTIPFTLTTWRGRTAYAVVLVPTTTFVEPGVTSPTYADVCVGEMVGATGPVSNDTVHASTVYVAPTRSRPPRPNGTFGTVASAGGSSAPGSCGTAGDAIPFTMVTWRGATSFTVDLDPATTFSLPGVTTPTYANVCVGELVSVSGAVSDTIISATAVHVLPVFPPQPQGAFGTVTSAGGSTTAGSCGTAGDTASFTIDTWRGSTSYTIDLSATTTFVEPSVVAPSDADICVGGLAGATGPVTDDTVAATTVYGLPNTLRLHPHGKFGTITAVGRSTTPGSCGTAGDTRTPFTLVTWSGTSTSYTVTVASTTAFVDQGEPTPSYADVCVGSVAGVLGPVAGAAVTATSISVTSGVPPPGTGSTGTTGNDQSGPASRPSPVSSAGTGAASTTPTTMTPSTGSSTPLALSPPPHPSPSLLGVYSGPGGSQPALGNFSTIVGHQPEYAMDFLDGSSWSSITESDYPYPYWKGLGYTMIWGVPMLPSTWTSTLAEGAAGDFNSDFVTVAQNIVNAGFPNSIIRLGWEFNGSWFPWAAGGQASAFVTYYQNIVTAMRSVAGENFTFEWNPTIGDQGVGDLAAYYPGNAYVNYIGLDVYDMAWGSYPGAQAEFNTLETETYGLNWLASFAAQEGKQIVLPEFGLGWSTGGEAGGGDDPTFINDMAQWISQNNVFEANFWDYGTSSVDNGANPNTAAALAADFG